MICGGPHRSRGGPSGPPRAPTLTPGQQPTDPADLIHLLQKLHILLLEAGVIVAHVLFCESLDNVPFKKKREPMANLSKKREKYTNIVTSKRISFFNGKFNPSGTGESN
jgi:hypothetical protein